MSFAKQASPPNPFRSIRRNAKNVATPAFSQPSVPPPTESSVPGDLVPPDSLSEMRRDRDHSVYFLRFLRHEKTTSDFH